MRLSQVGVNMKMIQSLIEPELIAGRKYIWVTFQKEGIHCYPAAATDPNLADVAYLANPHRHIFHFRVSIEVFHDDREIEFIQFKRWLESLYEGTLQLDYKSCEMIAEEIAQQIWKKYCIVKPRFLDIQVSEDNENGCHLYYM